MCGFRGGECRSAFHLRYESGQEEDEVYNVSFVQRARVETRTSTLVLTEIVVTVCKNYVKSTAYF